MKYKRQHMKRLKGNIEVGERVMWKVDKYEILL